MGCVSPGATPPPFVFSPSASTLTLSLSSSASILSLSSSSLSFCCFLSSSSLSFCCFFFLACCCCCSPNNILARSANTLLILAFCIKLLVDNSCVSLSVVQFMTSNEFSLSAAEDAVLRRELFSRSLSVGRSVGMEFMLSISAVVSLPR